MSKDKILLEKLLEIKESLDYVCEWDIPLTIYVRVDECIELLSNKPQTTPQVDLNWDWAPKDAIMASVHVTWTDDGGYTKTNSVGAYQRPIIEEVRGE